MDSHYNYIMNRSIFICYLSLLMVTRSVQVAPFRSSVKARIEATPCRRGKYADVTSHNVTRCRRCSVCRKGQQVKHECGAYSDTVCEECPSGTFNDVKGGTCQPCTRCMPGSYIRRYCSTTHNAICRPCPKHRYNTVMDTVACERCTRCKHHEKFIARCRKNKDTQCGECLQGYFRESSTGDCVRCSPCPYYDIKRYVVNECQRKMGLEHPDVCWPGVYTINIDTLGIGKTETFTTDIGSVELSVDGLDIDEEELLNTTTTMLYTLSALVVCTLVCMALALTVKLSRYRNHRSTEMGNITYNHDMHETSGHVHASEIQYITPVDDSTRQSYTSEKYTHSDTDHSSSIYDQSDQGDLNDMKTESAPTVFNNDNNSECNVTFTLGPSRTEKKKYKKRKKRTPPNVEYYTIPCNTKYFPQQICLTI